MEFFILLFILGAFWRRVDGSSLAPRFFHLYVFAVCLSVFLVGQTVQNAGYELELLPMLLPLFTAIALLDGFTDWNDWKLMSTHYSKYVAIGMVLANSISLPFLALSVVAGLCYPIIMRIPSKYIRGDNNWYCEIIAGGLLAGGLTLV